MSTDTPPSNPINIIKHTHSLHTAPSFPHSLSADLLSQLKRRPHPSKRTDDIHTQSNTSHSEEDEIHTEPLLAKNESINRIADRLNSETAAAAESGSSAASVLPRFKCRRCSQLIYEFDRLSHETSHSSLIFEPFLYLGGERNACNHKELTVRTQITHILNTAWEVANRWPNEFVYKNLTLIDSADEDILSILDDATAWIEMVRTESSHHRVLVHCVQGISRSATVVIAYLIRFHNYTLETALNKVKQQRHLIQPNPGFIKQLKQWELQCRQNIKPNT